MSAIDVGHPATSPRGRSFVGCSGWMYRDWRGVVYPADLPMAAWLADYATRFDTVELNSTFYRLPNVEAVRRWRATVPEGFVFSMKLGQFGSHRKKLLDPVPWLARHVEVLGELGDRRGPCLVQLPPRWRCNAPRLDEFLDAAPAEWRWAVEVRDRSWLDDRVFDVLQRHGAALCVHDLIADHPHVMTTDWTYVRFHGPNAIAEPYHGRYGSAGLAARAHWMSEVLDRGRDVYAYFNNDWHGNAVVDADTLSVMLAA